MRLTDPGLATCGTFSDGSNQFDRYGACCGIRYRARYEARCGACYDAFYGACYDARHRVSCANSLGRTGPIGLTGDP